MIGILFQMPIIEEYNRAQSDSNEFSQTPRNILPQASNPATETGRRVTGQPLFLRTLDSNGWWK